MTLPSARPRTRATSSRRPRAPRRSTAAAVLVSVAMAAGLLVPTSASAAAPGSFTASFEAGEAPVLGTAVGEPINVTGGQGAAGSVLAHVAEVTASGENPVAEVAAALADGNPSSKWLVFKTAAWAQYRLDAPTSIGSYTLTSGGDEAPRDPKDFRLLASNDGATWTTLDTQVGASFAGRGTTNTYPLPQASASFTYFRLDISRNNGSSNIIQLADWDLIDPTQQVSASPLALAVGSGPTSSSTAKTGVGFAGVAALKYSGRHLAAGPASSTTTLYDGVGVHVDAGTQLNYKVFPVLDGGQTYAATFVAVDLVFGDGTTLSGSDAVDAYGYGASARAQGAADVLWPDQWNSVTVDLSEFTGKTIQTIRFVYDHPGDDVTAVEKPGAGTAFSGWLDDLSIQVAAARDTSAGLVSYVDTRRGTNSTGGFSRGNNLPATALPNGFNFITPMTNADNVGTLYHYQRENDAQNRPSLNGIGLSHQPSIWMGDRNQLAVMPAANDNPTSDLNGRRLTFSHAQETARPDLYEVGFDNGLTTAVTPTDHGVIYRFTFAGGASSVLVDQLTGSSRLTVAGDTVSGWVDGGSGYPGRTRMFVYGRFDRSPTAFGPTTVGNRNGSARYAAFDTTTDRSVELRLTSSFISQAQAQHNYDLELAGVSFEQAHTAAQDAWNARLSAITDIEGATDAQLVTTYSSLYRLNLYPNSQFENTGTPDSPAYAYASPTLPTQGAATDTTTNAQVVSGKIYVNNGFWDTYRTAWPLYSLLYPDQTQELVDGFVEQYRNGGWIARWSSPGYADLMTGTSSDVSFAEAYATGAISTPLALEAFDAAVKNATVLPASNAVGRKGLDQSIFLGYTQEATHESASWGLEGFINDYGIAQMAGRLAADPETPDARRAELREQETYFAARSEHFAELFNPDAGTFTARNADGSWPVDASFDKKSWGGAFTEASAWTFGYHAPHDVAGLAALYGGRRALVDNLHAFLTTREMADHSGIHEAREARDVRLGMLGFSNQVSHHIPYVLAEAGDPAGAQALIRDIENRMFVGSDIGQGYPGDEDNGEMSAWFVFSALGFYPLQAGSGDYTIGTPLFDSAKVHFGDKVLTVRADGASAGKKYVAGVRLNGTAIDTTTFDGAELRSGGTLTFAMSATPSEWGAKDLDESLAVPTTLVDATASGFGSLSSADGTPVGALTDDNMRSSAEFAAGTADLQWTSASGPVTVDSYTLTSHTLAGAPASWTLSGSTDGQTWQTLDARTAQNFQWADQTRPFTTASRGGFTHYRLELSAAAGTALDLDEIELFATAAVGSETSVTAASAQTVAVGAEFTGGLATIVGAEPAADGYTVTVDYGDAKPVDAVTLTGNGLGGYTVRAPHVFDAAGVYTASVTVRDSAGFIATASSTVEATLDATLTGALNVACIGDLNVTAANCDAQHYGYDRAKLNADGFVQGTTVALAQTPLTYDLPAVAPGAADNVTAEGQTIKVQLGAGATQIALIGTATEKARELAATLTYTDGSTQPLSIGFGDWVGASGSPQYRNTVVAISEGRLTGTAAESAVKNAAIYATVPLALLTDAAGNPKTVESLTLPQEPGTLRDGRAHIFAIASDGDRTGIRPLTIAGSAVADQQAGVAFEAALAQVSGGAEQEKHATVNWGDGSPVSRVSVVDGGVAAGHTYTAAGTYTVSVTADDTLRSATTTTAVVVAAAPVYTPTLTLPTEAVSAGATVPLAGAGFAPGETVRVTLGSGEAVPAIADDDGALRLDLRIPADAVDGAYPVAAIGDTSHSSASGTITVRSAPPIAQTSVTVTASADATVGAPLTLSAVVSPQEATGQVIFREDEAIVGSATASGGVATADVVPATAGEHRYTASFVPDSPDRFAASTSSVLVVSVEEAPAAGAPRLTLSTASAIQGSTVALTGVGFAAGESIVFELHSDPIRLGAAVADARGVVRTTLSIPATAPVGEHRVVAIGTSSGSADAPLTVLASDTGNTAGTTPQGVAGILGSTGGTIAFWLLGLAIVLLVAGGLALKVRRSRVQQ